MADPKDDFFGPDPDTEEWDNCTDSVVPGDYNDPDRDDGMNSESFDD